MEEVQITREPSRSREEESEPNTPQAKTGDLSVDLNAPSMKEKIDVNW